MHFQKSENKLHNKDKTEIIKWFLASGLKYDQKTPTITKVDNNNYTVLGQGLGLELGSNEMLPKVCTFGKIKVLLDKLYHKNILSIQNNNGLKIPGFKNTPVSDGFLIL